jgi:hypothetical protein
MRHPKETKEMNKNIESKKMTRRGGTTMNTIVETLRSFVMREKVLQRFEKEAVTGSETGFDVFLKKGVEYVARGKVAKGKGIVRLSLGDSQDTTVPVYGDAKGTVLSVVPERDGVYRLGARVEATAKNADLLTVGVTLSSVATPSTYMLEPYMAAYYRIPGLEKTGTADTDRVEELRQSKAS